MFDSLPVFIPIFAVLIFLIVIGVFVYVISHSISERIKNDKAPIENLQAVVVAKRMSVSGGSGDSAASTSYYVTFELGDNSRLELCVKSGQYGTLAEGDRGVLTRQRARFLGFQRQDDRFSAADPSKVRHKCANCGAVFTGPVCEYCGAPADS